MFKKLFNRNPSIENTSGRPRRKIKTRPTLSVVCISNSPLERTARILSHFNEVADEIICAVDSRAPTSEFSHLHGIVDLIAPCEINTGVNHNPHRGQVAHTYGWRHSLASSEWIFIIDSDEVVSTKLLTTLPKLLQTDDVLQYLIPRFWLFPDFSHYINESIWLNDTVKRLFRNDPATMYFPGAVHSGIELKQPYRHTNTPIYHLDCVLNSQEQRIAKKNLYKAGQPNSFPKDNVWFNDCYHPEHFPISNYMNVPEEDYALIQEVMAPLTGIPKKQKLWKSQRKTQYLPFTSNAEIEKYWALRTVPTSAYRAKIVPIQIINYIKINETKHILVSITNEGTETWPMSDRYPQIRLGDRWHSIKDQTIFFEGSRTLFTENIKPGTVTLRHMSILAPAEPGEYFLELDIVHEHVRWFNCGIKLPITVIT